MMREATVIGQCLRYPYPGHGDDLTAAVEELPAGTIRRDLERFLSVVLDLPEGRWEELHTATLDLSPQFVPYVGHMAWGESYKRGAFMASLKRQMEDIGVTLNGELPDHLEPILRYLDVAAVPDEELVDVLPGAVAAMAKELKKSDASNPYRHVLAAVRTYVAAETRVEIGRSHER